MGLRLMVGSTQLEEYSDLNINVLERGGVERIETASSDGESVQMNRIHNEQSDDPDQSSLPHESEQQ